MKTESHSKLLRQPKHCQVLIYAILSIWTLIRFFPFYWTVATSLKGPLDIVSGPVYLPLIDYSPSVDAWRYILFNSGGHFFQRYLNSMVVASAATALTVFLGAFAVYGLTRFRNTPWFVVTLGGTAGLMIGAALVSGMPAELTFMTALVALLGAASLWRMPYAVQNHMMTFAILASRIVPPVVVVTPIYLVAQHSQYSALRKPISRRRRRSTAPPACVFCSTLSYRALLAGLPRRARSSSCYAGTNTYSPSTLRPIAR
jgi:multiple sugar transport system permease protein